MLLPYSLCYAFFLLITRCFSVWLHQYELSLWCQYVKYWVHSSFSSRSPAPFLHRGMDSSLLTQQKSCHTFCTHTLLSFHNLETVILEFSFDCSFMGLDLKCLVHHNFHCSLRFIFPDSHRYCRNEASSCSAGELSWLLTSKLYLEGISSLQSALSVSRNGLAIAPVLVHGSCLFIWKVFAYVVQHKAISCSKCRKLKHLLKWPLGYLLGMVKLYLPWYSWGRRSLCHHKQT